MNTLTTDSPSRPIAVLLVDDDADCRLLVREIIASAAARADVHEAASAAEALDFLHRRGALAGAPRPDLVYLDVELPDRSGREVLRDVRADPALRDVAVVMLTGVDDPSEEAAALADGADGYVIKPAEPGRFLHEVGAAVARWTEGIAASPAAGGACAAPPPRVLVVEDDADQRALVCEVLADRYGPGSRGRIAPVGTAAECLAADPARFDVVLLDYHLPDMDGLEALRAIRAAADVPVVFVTGVNDTAIAAEAVRRGAQDYVVKLGDYLFALPVIVEKSVSQHRVRRDNERLRRQLELMLRQLRRKNEQLRDALARMEKLAVTDHLTGLWNRRQFHDALRQQFALAARHGHDLACCMCDLDDYKALNDAQGHQAGDDVLAAAAEAIRATLRQSDLAARYGGDELVLLLPHTGVEAAVVVARRLAEAFRSAAARFALAGKSLTMSIGVASLAANCPESPDALVSMADQALYDAKQAGKDCIRVCVGAAKPAGT